MSEHDLIAEWATTGIGTWAWSDATGTHVIYAKPDTLELLMAERAKIAEAYDYAVRLATSLADRYPDRHPEWEPLPDLIGVLTQIDNATTGLVHPGVLAMDALKEAAARLMKDEG